MPSRPSYEELLAGLKAIEEATHDDSAERPINHLTWDRRAVFWTKLDEARALIARAGG
jgi:hypothetical protein